MLDDIYKRIQQDFKASADEAFTLIERFENKTKLSPRITRCIIHLANGDIEGLKKAIRQAEADWRDVIILAENVDFEFNKPFEI